MSKEAMKQWADDVSKAYDILAFGHTERAAEILAKTRNAMREALAEQPAQQEPVGEIGKIILFGGQCKEVSWRDGKMPPVGSVLYTSPPAQRTWVGLSDAQNTVIWANSQSVDEAIRATEKQLMENNI